MKNLIKKSVGLMVAVLAFTAMTAFSPVVTPSVLAADPECIADNKTGDIDFSAPASTNIAGDGIKCAQGAGTPSTLFGTGSIFTTVVNVMLFIIGAVSVIMLIWGGIRYTTSAGNSAAVTSAKNTIMYAIIGLIIAFLAFAIVNWVLGAITPTATP